MGKIKELDKNLINQIAAGEVVERPLSVVKELVENSLDAGAKNVKIEIFSGGKEKIIISDDGEGIEESDLEIILKKHTTSKISSISDLQNILSFGFRGEALASISSVSNFSILTKTEKGNGKKLFFENENQIISDFATEKGTKIIIENLFYNVPARLAYLKTDFTESSHIIKLVNNLSLANPEIGFELFSDGRNILKFKENENLRDRIYSIYGKNIFENLIEIDSDLEDFRIFGYISSPKISSHNKDKQEIFVNKRIIKSQVISKAVNEGFSRFIAPKTFPFFVLNLELNPEKVDVNVHPRKSEVRFLEEKKIYSNFYNLIKNKLEKVSLYKSEENVNSYNIHTFFTESPEYSQNGNFTNTSQYLHKSNNFQNFNNFKQDKFYIPSGTNFKEFSPYKDIFLDPTQQNLINFQSGQFGQNENISNFSELDSLKTFGKVIGQAFNSYIILETEDSLKILDQHAVAERVIYEKLLKNSKKVNSQKLLIPEIISLSEEYVNFINENLETFLEMKFSLRFLGNDLIIEEVPDFATKENIKELFLNILDDLKNSFGEKSKSLEEIKNKIFAYTACRSAVKFGNKLSEFEMQELIKDANLDYSLTCPHGRPVIFEITLKDLKGKYDR